MIDFSNKNPASCFIELAPDLYEDGSWTGALRITILTSKDNPMPEASKESLLHLAQLVSSTVALMEKDENLRAKAMDFLRKEDEAYDKKDKPNIVDTYDNVIVVSFDKEDKKC